MFLVKICYKKSDCLLLINNYVEDKKLSIKILFINRI